MDSPEAFVPAKSRRKRFFSFNTFAQTPVGSPPPSLTKQSPPSAKGSARKQLAFGSEAAGSPAGKGNARSEIRANGEGPSTASRKLLSNGPSSFSPSSSSVGAKTSANNIPVTSCSSCASCASSSSSSRAPIVSEPCRLSFSNVASSRLNNSSSSLASRENSLSGVGPPKSSWGVPGSRLPDASNGISTDKSTRPEQKQQPSLPQKQQPQPQKQQPQPQPQKQQPQPQKQQPQSQPQKQQSQSQLQKPETKQPPKQESHQPQLQRPPPQQSQQLQRPPPQQSQQLQRPPPQQSQQPKQLQQLQRPLEQQPQRPPPQQPQQLTQQQPQQLTQQQSQQRLPQQPPQLSQQEQKRRTTRASPARVASPVSSPNSSSPEQRLPHLTPLWLCFLDHPEHYLPDYSPPFRATSFQTYPRHPPQQRGRPSQRHQPQTSQPHERPLRRHGAQGQRPKGPSTSESSLPHLSNPPTLNQKLQNQRQQQQQQQGEEPNSQPQPTLSKKQIRIRTQKRRLVEREQQQRFLALLAQLTKKAPPIDRPRSQSLTLSNSRLLPKNRSLSDVKERPDLLQSVDEQGSRRQELTLSTPQKLQKPSAFAQKSPPVETQVETTMQQLLSLRLHQEEEKELEQELQYKLRAQLIKQKRKAKNKFKKERAKLLAAEKGDSASAPDTSAPAVEDTEKTFIPSTLRSSPLLDVKEASSESTFESLAELKIFLPVPVQERNYLTPPERPTSETRKGSPDLTENKERLLNRNSGKNSPLSPLLTTPPRHPKSRPSRETDLDASSGFSSSGSGSDYSDKKMAMRFRNLSPENHLPLTRPVRSQSDVAPNISPRKQAPTLPARPSPKSRLSQVSNSSPASAHSPSPIKWGFLLRPRSHTESEIDYPLSQLRRSHTPLVALSSYSFSSQSASDRPSASELPIR